MSDAAERDYRRRLGKAIVQLRAIREGMSQAELAEALGRSEAAVSRWETGKVTPTAYDLVRLTEVLDVPAALLLSPPDLPASPIAAMLQAVAERSADYAVDEALDEPRGGGAPRDPAPLPEQQKR